LKRIELTMQDLKKLLKERKITENGVTIDLHKRVTLDKITDYVWDLRSKEWEKGSHPGWSSTPLWGDYQEGKDVTYEGSPFDSGIVDGLSKLWPDHFDQDVLKAKKPVVVKYAADW